MLLASGLHSSKSASNNRANRTGQNRSDNERAIMIAGFGTTYFPFKYMESHRPDFELDAEFLRNVPPSVRHDCWDLDL